MENNIGFDERLTGGSSATGLLLSQSTARYIMIHPADLIFDVRSLFSEATYLKEELMEPDWDVEAAKAKAAMNDKTDSKAAIATVMSAHLTKMTATHSEFKPLMLLLARRCARLPFVVSRHKLPSYISRCCSEANPTDLVPAMAEFLVDLDASEPTLLTNRPLAVCARHTGAEILGIRLSDQELLHRVNVAIKAAEEGKWLNLARSYTNLETYYSDHTSS